MAGRNAGFAASRRRTARGNRWWVVPGSLVAAMLLAIIPYPDWMHFAVPRWVSLVLFYWCIAIPDRVGVGSGWIVGLVMDLLLHTLLGMHAVSMAFVAMVGVTFHRRIRLYQLWQQCLMVFIITVIEIAFTGWVFHLTNGVSLDLVYWQAALTSALVWPVVYTVLRFLRQRSGMVELR